MKDDNHARGQVDEPTEKGPDTGITSEEHIGSAQIDNRNIDECADSTTQSEHPSQPNKPEKSPAITREQYFRSCFVLTDPSKIMSESDVRNCRMFLPGVRQQPRIVVVMPGYKENVSPCGSFEMRGHSEEMKDAIAPITIKKFEQQDVEVDKATTDEEAETVVLLKARLAAKSARAEEKKAQAEGEALLGAIEQAKKERCLLDRGKDTTVYAEVSKGTTRYMCISCYVLAALLVVAILALRCLAVMGRWVWRWGLHTTPPRLPVSLSRRLLARPSCAEWSCWWWL
jgi:hypothetical protein